MPTYCNTKLNHIVTSVLKTLNELMMRLAVDDEEVNGSGHKKTSHVVVDQLGLEHVIHKGHPVCVPVDLSGTFWPKNNFFNNLIKQNNLSSNGQLG